MKILSIGNFGTGVKIDNDDFDWLNQWKWTYDATNGYVHRNQFASGKKTKIYMHRLITDAPKGKQVDHINGDRLDNRRNNLRLVTHAQNTWNKKVRGISWHKASNKWMVQVKHNGNRMYLGTFKSETEATKKYFDTVNRLRGEFVR